MKAYNVYWIHLPEHVDIFSQGYIGITGQPINRRMWKHLSLAKNDSKFVISKALNKYKDVYLVDILCICNKDYARELELKLRPNDFIGWNMRIGGMRFSERTPTQEAERVEKWSLAMDGNFPSGEAHWNWQGGFFTIHKTKGYTPEEIFNRKSDLIALRMQDTIPPQNGPWMTLGSNKVLWKLADEVYDLWENLKCGDKILANKLGIPRSNTIKNMLDMFRHGWVPLKDQQFMRFKNA